MYRTISNCYGLIRKSYTSMTYLNVFIFVSRLFGSYVNTAWWFWRLYCISVTLLTSIVVIKFDVLPRTTKLLITIEFNLYCLIAQYTGNEYFLRFCSTVNTHDNFAGIKNGAIVTSYAVAMFFFIIIYFIFYTILVMNMYEINSSMLSLIIMMILINLTYLKHIIVFTLIHNRMKILRQSFEKIFVPVNIIGADEIANKIRVIRRGLRNYNNLLDNFQNIQKELQTLMSIALIVNLQKLVFHSYVTLVFFLKGNLSNFSFLIFGELCAFIILIFSPCIFIELTINEVEKIKAVLNNRLLRCSDEFLRFELETTLEYVSRRPFRFIIWRAIPVDVNLPIGLLGLVTSYVILTIQFMHFNI